MDIPQDIQYVYFENVLQQEIDDAVDTVMKLHDKVNQFSNQVADREDHIKEMEDEQTQHEMKYRWISENLLGEVPMYFFAWFIALLLPIAEILLVGVQAASSLFNAAILPILLSICHIGILMYIARLRISLSGNKWPLPELPEAEKRLSLRDVRTYPLLVRSKWLIVLCLTAWAFMVLALADIESVKLHNEDARTDAILLGTSPELEEIPGFLDVALRNPVIIFYTFVVFLGNGLVALFGWHLYGGFSYFFGYRGKHKRFKKQLREERKKLRAALQSLYHSFGHYRAKTKEYDVKYPTFKAPPESFSHRTLKYIDDHFSKRGSSPMPALEPTTDPPSGDGHGEAADLPS